MVQNKIYHWKFSEYLYPLKVQSAHVYQTKRIYQNIFERVHTFADLFFDEQNPKKWNI